MHTSPRPENTVTNMYRKLHKLLSTPKYRFPACELHDDNFTCVVKDVISSSIGYKMPKVHFILLGFISILYLSVLLGIYFITQVYGTVLSCISHKHIRTTVNVLINSFRFLKINTEIALKLKK